MQDEPAVGGKMGKNEEIMAGLQTAYIDYNYNSNLAYRPQFVSNDYKKGRKVLASIESELKNCEEFFISVAWTAEVELTLIL